MSSKFNFALVKQVGIDLDRYGCIERLVVFFHDTAMPPYLDFNPTPEGKFPRFKLPEAELLKHVALHAETEREGNESSTES